MPLAAVSSARALTARPSVSERRSRRSSGAVLWETPRASSSDLSIRRRLLRFASGGGFDLLVPLGDRRDLAQLALDPLHFRGHDRQVDDEEDEEDDVGAGDVPAGLVERQRRGSEEQLHQLTSGAIREPPPLTGASRARRRRLTWPEALFAVSSNLTRVVQSRAIAASEQRKASIISPGIPPSAVAKVRGWTRLCAIRTAMKLSGTKAPAVTAKTEAYRAWRSRSSTAYRKG